MKIVTPLTHVDYYQPLVGAGADEFFCGIIPYRWLEKYKNLIPLNRREYLYYCNICTMSSMKILSRMVEEFHVPVKITFNSLYYNEELYPVVTDIIRELMEMNFNTFIIADIALIVYLREKGVDCSIHLSGESGAFNRLAINFYNVFNISRHIFSRKTTIEEMKSCIQNCSREGIEFEAFALNELCPFTGAYCNTIHCDEMTSICRVPYRNSRINQSSDKFSEPYHMFKVMNKINKSMTVSFTNDDSDSGSKIEGYTLGKTGCGLCKIGELIESGITHLKVVGRGKSLDYIIKDIVNIKEIVSMTEAESNSTRFAEIIREKYFANRCPEHCYYP